MSRFHKQFFTFEGFPGNNHCIYRKCFRFFCRTASLCSLFHIIPSLRRTAAGLPANLCKNLVNPSFALSLLLSAFFFQVSPCFLPQTFSSAQPHIPPRLTVIIYNFLTLFYVICSKKQEKYKTVDKRVPFDIYFLRNICVPFFHS